MDKPDWDRYGAPAGYDSDYEGDRGQGRDVDRDWAWDRQRASTEVPGRSANPPPGPTRAQDEPSSGRQRRRRWPKVLAIVAVVLLLLLVVADRVIATVVAPDIMKTEITASIAETNTDPNVPPAQVTDVSLGGIPFLSQVFLGNYKDIRLSLAGISIPDGPRISAVDARLQGLSVPFGDAVRDQIKEVPVEEVEATVSVTYADLNAWLPQATDNNLQVTPVDGGESVQASFDFEDPLFDLGTQTVKGTASFSVTNGQLTLQVSEVELDGTFNIPGIQIPLPSIELPLPDLPFDLTVVDAGTDGAGVSLTARARDVILPAG